jgi:hypothetical protein
MRIYVPASLDDVAALIREGMCARSAGFAVTSEFRSAHEDVADEEELEFLAMTSAAAESFAQQGTGGCVVLAADVPDELLVHDALGEGRITFPHGLERAAVASAHVDFNTDSESEADASTLLWFANQEFETLLQEKP